jgi:hypothetical protein
MPNQGTLLCTALMPLLVLATAGAAIAQELPRFDVAAYCHQIATRNNEAMNFDGEFSSSEFAGCKRIEQSAYDELTGNARWDKFPGAMRESCLKKGSADAYSPSYRQLLRCLAGS